MLTTGQRFAVVGEGFETRLGALLANDSFDVYFLDEDGEWIALCAFARAEIQALVVIGAWALIEDDGGRGVEGIAGAVVGVCRDPFAHSSKHIGQ